MIDRLMRFGNVRIGAAEVIQMLILAGTFYFIGGGTFGAIMGATFMLLGLSVDQHVVDLRRELTDLRERLATLEQRSPER